MIESIKAVFIDLDGTLIDSLKIYEEVNKLTIKELYNIDIGNIGMDTMGYPPNEIIENIFQQFNIKDNINNFLKYRDKKLLENINKIKLNRGATELLSFLKSINKKIGIVTSSTKYITDEILDKMSLKNFFDIIVTYNDTEKQKPEPDPYIYAIKKLNLLPHECLAIEDSIYGILSAKRAGLMVFAVTTGANKAKDLKYVKPDKIFKSLTDIYKFLKSDFENYNNSNNQ